jgi:hypothetical protein
MQRLEVSSSRLVEDFHAVRTHGDGASSAGELVILRHEVKDLGLPIREHFAAIDLLIRDGRDQP